jgi:hypothetical protein
MDSRSLPLFHELVRVIEHYRNLRNVEIEIRIGWKHEQPRFSTDIGRSFFNTILDTLSTSNLERIDETTDVHIQGVLRRITGPKGTVLQKKKRIETIDFSAEGTPYDIRISVCQEIPVTQSTHDAWSFLRRRKRTSFRYKMWHYDMSECTLSKPVDEYVEDLCSYEFELELDTRNIQGLSSSYIAHSGVVKVLDILYMNDFEKINLKSTHLTSRNKQRTQPSKSNR